MLQFCPRGGLTGVLLPALPPAGSLSCGVTRRRLGRLRSCLPRTAR